MNEKPLMVGAFGARGVGKTQWLIRWLKARRAPRLVLWDFKHDPALVGLGLEVRDLERLCRAMMAPRWHLRYIVDHDRDIGAQFDLFCRAVYTAGDCTAYVGELAEVTAPGRAPRPWKKLVNVGREYTRWDGAVVGVTIAGDSQRMAECDKAFTSNLDLIHCGRMGHEDDARAAARILVCDWQELMRLPDLHYLERAQGAAAATRGVLTFRNTAKKSSPEPRATLGKAP